MTKVMPYKILYKYNKMMLKNYKGIDMNNLKKEEEEPTYTIVGKTRTNLHNCWKNSTSSYSTF